MFWPILLYQVALAASAAKFIDGGGDRSAATAAHNESMAIVEGKRPTKRAAKPVGLRWNLMASSIKIRSRCGEIAFLADVADFEYVFL